MNDDDTPEISETDDDRLLLLDRIAERLPEMNLDDYSIEWVTLPDGGEALVIDGGGFDGGTGYFIANSPVGDDLHVVGPTAPLAPGAIGCVVIDADGGRRLARLIRNPLADEADPDS